MVRLSGKVIMNETEENKHCCGNLSKCDRSGEVCSLRDTFSDIASLYKRPSINITDGTYSIAEMLEITVREMDREEREQLDCCGHPASCGKSPQACKLRSWYVKTYKDEIVAPSIEVELMSRFLKGEFDNAADGIVSPPKAEEPTIDRFKDVRHLLGKGVSRRGRELER
jgi:hypothetical protein